MNPVVRAVLASPAGRWVGALAVLELTGRRSGRRSRVRVGWHEVDGTDVVFTPAGWRENLRGGAEVVVRHRGRVRHGRAELVDDPAVVAAALIG